jgi:putative ABC transport system ATP-binding protein
VKGARTREPPSDRVDGASNILVARGVSKAYRVGESEIAALRGVDLEVARGSFVSVVGPSGSGKTTLLHCLSGIDTIDSGTVEIEGEDVHRLPEAKRAAQRARLMGFVFQSLNLLPILSVLENVELPLMLQRRPAKEARSVALLALERVGLSHRVDHRPGELSGGEQQRAAVARALAGSPAIVWADEPTGNLDSASAAALVDLLAELNAGGLTLMLVTHDAAVAARAERRISMRDGRIVEDTAG